MSKNITFSRPADEKVLDKSKTMTTRFWHKNYPKPVPGEIVTASTGRRKETRFAKLRIIQVVTWKPEKWTNFDYMLNTGYSPQVIAEKEGFSNFNEFFNTYAVINDHLDPDDPDRSHYFIEFELVEIL